MPGVDIVSRLHALRARIDQAAHEAGRRPDNVRLIAVSKTHPASAIAAAADAGQLEFGENTVQEALPKIEQLAPRGLTWHYVGHLQSNKAKFVPGRFTWFHSLDNAKLATRLARFAHERGVVLNTLIEVNITRDPAKHGVLPDALYPLLDELLRQNLAGLPLRGLMTIGPYPATEPEIRASFAGLAKLRNECARRYALAHFGELSMGMSGDYIEAIKEGATLLRVGTAIFGERDYTLS